MAIYTVKQFDPKTTVLRSDKSWNLNFPIGCQVLEVPSIPRLQPTLLILASHARSKADLPVAFARAWRVSEQPRQTLVTWRLIR